MTGTIVTTLSVLVRPYYDRYYSEVTPLSVLVRSYYDRYYGDSPVCAGPNHCLHTPDRGVNHCLHTPG